MPPSHASLMGMLPNANSRPGPPPIWQAQYSISYVLAQSTVIPMMQWVWCFNTALSFTIWLQSLQWPAHHDLLAQMTAVQVFIKNVASNIILSNYKFLYVWYAMVCYSHDIMHYSKSEIILQQLCIADYNMQYGHIAGCSPCLGYCYCSLL